MTVSLPDSICSSEAVAGRWPARRLACLALALMLAAGLAPAAAQSLAPTPQTVASVLMYHRVGNADHPSTNVTEAQFRAHLDYLETEGFNVVPLARVVEALEGDQPLPPRTVAITFDDGYRSVGEVAHPLLEARGWPYTVFVNTAPVNAGQAGHMSWERMRELAADGVRFANHSRSHAPLFHRPEGETRPRWRDRVRADLMDARVSLRDELGEAVHQSPPLLAYPYGEYSPALMSEVAELGFVAFGQQSGAIGVHANSLALPRHSFNQRYAEMDRFRVKVHSRALPVIEQAPLDPVRRDRAAPALSLTLAPSPDLQAGQLACYYRGERLLPQWDESGERFSVQGEAPVPVGRSRYNCTAPDGQGRYFWFSQLWVHGEGGT